MILDKKIEIKISRRNIDHYRKFYNNLKLKDIIEVDTEFQLQKNSNKKINVLNYKNYNINFYKKNGKNGEDIIIYVLNLII